MNKSVLLLLAAALAGVASGQLDQANGARSLELVSRRLEGETEPLLDEAPVEEPVEVPVEEPVEVPVEEPVEEPVEAPVEEPVEVPVEEPVEVPVEEPTPEGILPERFVPVADDDDDDDETSPSPSPTRSRTPSSSRTPSVTSSPSRTPSITPSSSRTPSLTPSTSVTPSITPSISVTATRTRTRPFTPPAFPSVIVPPVEASCIPAPPNWNGNNNHVWPSEARMLTNIFCPSATPSCRPSSNNNNGGNHNRPSPSPSSVCVPLEWSNANGNTRALWICPSSSPRPARNSAPPVIALHISVRINLRIRSLTPSALLARLRIIFLMRSSLAALTGLPIGNIRVGKLVDLGSGNEISSFAPNDFINRLNSWAPNDAGRLLRSGGVDVPEELRSSLADVQPQDAWISAPMTETLAQIDHMFRSLQDYIEEDMIAASPSPAADAGVEQAAADTAADGEGIAVDFDILLANANGLALPKLVGDNVISDLDSSDPTEVFAPLLQSDEAKSLGITGSALDIAADPTVRDSSDPANIGGSGSAPSSSSSSGKLSAGPIAGIVIGCIAAVALAAALVVGGPKGLAAVREARQQRRQRRPSAAAGASGAAPAAAAAPAAGVGISAAVIQA